MEIVMWKDVKGYEDLFQVNENGDIFSIRTGKILKPTIGNKGYRYISTKVGGRNGQCIAFKISRAVADAFLPNPSNLPVVNHLDGDKGNDAVSNLEWTTYEGNTKHAWSMGLCRSVKGHEKTNAKLTEEQVSFIRNNARQLGGNMSQRELAEIVGLHHTNVGKCIRAFSYN